jgi:hypothetical protein
MTEDDKKAVAACHAHMQVSGQAACPPARLPASHSTSSSATSPARKPALTVIWVAAAAVCELPAGGVAACDHAAPGIYQGDTSVPGCLPR